MGQSNLDQLAQVASGRSNRQRRRATYRRPGRAVRSDNPNVLLAIVSFVIPTTGIIIAAIFLSRPEPDAKATGRICLICSLINLVLIGLAWLMFWLVVIDAAATIDNSNAARVSPDTPTPGDTRHDPNASIPFRIGRKPNTCLLRRLSDLHRTLRPPALSS
jgi:hypothetical protein